MILLIYLINLLLGHIQIKIFFYLLNIFEKTFLNILFYQFEKKKKNMNLEYKYNFLGIFYIIYMR